MGELIVSAAQLAARSAALPCELPDGPRIVLGVDSSPGAARAVVVCARLARNLGATVIAVHATLSSTDAPTPDLLQRWCRPLRDLGVAFYGVAADDDAMPLLCEIADIVDAEFIVVGGTGRGELREFLFGGVGFELAHHGNRPVLIVPASNRRQVRPPAP